MAHRDRVGGAPHLGLEELRERQAGDRANPSLPLSQDCLRPVHLSDSLWIRCVTRRHGASGAVVFRGKARSGPTGGPVVRRGGLVLRSSPAGRPIRFRQEGGTLRK
ncbi:hypothetical protein SCATT_26680 [Streptantibioticus cattleyicolor NRRL 8057 = DSM 46488]|uniref:Uncharacterized protein n=1 Tax=Streptantibioticus cattleyicolor (strain ATCC 35852 / DSM 46488 / JCM 4925 / NBRC 14057 / NRRL 8057) TaxID=1003195 RepID=G8WZR3_STREN|nr:hypothetical protein SCATT_26680 [Streptantibioticus cattleyicolor NRRL 8057 = DSM 46488]